MGYAGCVSLAGSLRQAGPPAAVQVRHIVTSPLSANSRITIPDCPPVCRSIKVVPCWPGLPKTTRLFCPLPIGEGNRILRRVAGGKGIGNHQTVIKSLGTLYRKTECISGATITGDGNVALILDLAGIIRSARNDETAIIARSTGTWRAIAT